MSAGIDYGRGLTNIDQQTGIRYGVVSLNSLAGWVIDEFFDNGTDETMRQIEADYREENGLSVDEEIPEEWYDDLEIEEAVYTLETDGMSLGLNYLGGAALVWVYKSPVTAKCSFCSPCCPGAGDLDNKRDDGVETYSLPDEWFDE